MKKINLLLILGITMLFACMQPKMTIVCNKDKINQLKITTDEFLGFFIENHQNLINDKNPSLFTNMKVISNGKHSYIIARDTVNSKTFAIELKQIGNKLCFDIYSVINICECLQTDESSFVIKPDGSINGCNGGIHTISQTTKE
jgi:hypothetical protein